MLLLIPLLPFLGFLLNASLGLNLGVDLRIDESYIPDMNQRLMLYRKVAAARHDAEIGRVLEEAADRYGPLPESFNFKSLKTLTH